MSEYDDVVEFRLTRAQSKAVAKLWVAHGGAGRLILASIKVDCATCEPLASRVMCFVIRSKTAAKVKAIARADFHANRKAESKRKNGNPWCNVCIKAHGCKTLKAFSKGLNEKSKEKR